MVDYENIDAPAPCGEACGGSLRDHVYHPARLLVRQQRISVTGTIVHATNGCQPDGAFEVVCKFQVKRPDAERACAD